MKLTRILYDRILANDGESVKVGSMALWNISSRIVSPEDITAYRTTVKNAIISS